MFTARLPTLLSCLVHHRCYSLNETIYGMKTHGVHRLEVHRMMNFHNVNAKIREEYTTTNPEDPRCPSQSLSLKGCHSHFSHHRLVSPDFGLFINGVIQYVFTCLWLPLLNATLERFIHILACSLNPFIILLNSITWIQHSLFILLLIDIWAGSS